MSELLDAFDDAGLVDGETRAFLVEALSNAEASDWADILEPFVSPVDAALAALQNVPNVLARSQRALEAAAEALAEEEKVDPLADYFLKALPLPGGVLSACGLHAAAAVARVCRAARAACCTELFWQSRLDGLSRRWPLARAPPADRAAAATVELRAAELRSRYLAALRPRCDGVYVGECQFKRWLRLGHHMDLRKNAEQLAMKAGRGGGGEWIHYRRYVRLLPPDMHDGVAYAFVLQDPCPRDVAERVLIAGVDPMTHANPAKSEGVLNDNTVHHANDADRLRKRICLGTYTYTADGCVEVRYTAADGNFHLTFSLSHGGSRVCSDRLKWENYTLEDESSEVISFNLGRLEDWRGGGLADENKDHFPQMQFRPKRALEHLL